MIYKGKTELNSRYYGLRVVAAVYKGVQLVWEAVTSCFGSGMWNSDKAWKNTDGWKR